MAVQRAVLVLAVATGVTLVTSGPAGATGAARAGSSGPGASSPVYGALRGVAATSAQDAWAVGTSILHWNGTAWQPVPTPGIAADLLSVAATSARNAWAIGYIMGVAGSSLIVHWNGTAWQRIHSPLRLNLVGVAATSARDAWAIGSQNFRDDPQKTVILHWNGTAWKRRHPPSPPGARLEAVAATSARNA